MNTVAKLAPAKLAGPDIAPPRADESLGAASSLPVVAIVSVGLHALIALALVSLPLPTSVAPALDMTWLAFDIEEAPAAAPEVVREVEPEPEVVPEPIAPPPEVRRERPQPVAAVEPQVVPEPAPIAPPSIDDVFGEPPPPAAVMTGEGPSAFAMAPGELGGAPGGTPGGHGTSLVSTVRPAPPQEVGPSEADRRRARRGYVHTIEELVRSHTRYPRAAAREGLQGRVELALRVGADGRLIAIRIATSSGSPILDDAATAAAREIDRVPAPPAIASLTSSDEVRVGVVYMVR